MRAELLALLLCAWSAQAEPPDSDRLPQDTERVLRPTNEDIDASEAVDELVEEMAADLARLEAKALSPILIEGVGVSDNLNPDFAAILEGRMIRAVGQASNVRLLRCAECGVMQSRVEQGVWVVSRGIHTREQRRELAQRYGAGALLTVTLSMNEAADALALDAMLVRGEDAAVLWAESYRFHANSVLLYGSSDAVVAREAKLKDLRARIEGRPVFGHSALFGYMVVPAENDGPVTGAYFAYRLYEQFGVEREYRVGILASGFINTSRLAGAIIALGLQRRVTPESVFAPAMHLGGQAGFLLTGTAGNSPIFSLTGEYRLVHRIAVQASLGYLLPFELGPTGKVGGFSPQVGVAFVW